MSGMPSLESSIRTCQVDTAWANRAQSDRFLNSNALTCPTWGGTDLAGRQVCPDSFWTKSPGCNSALDRVAVENAVSRPLYFEYIALNSQGLQGSMYGTGGCGGKAQSQNRDRMLAHTQDYAGNFNNALGGNVIGACAPGDMGFAQYQQAARQKVAAQSQMQTEYMKRGAGFA